MHWLDRYGTDYHRWQPLPDASITPSETWCRPIGIVESMFDTDGTDFEGRADINTVLEAELSVANGNISPDALRKKILLAWTVLRLRHVLLSARAVYRAEVMPERGAELAGDRFFVVRKPRNVQEMMEEGSRTVDFVADHYPQLDVEDFHMHVLNTGRVFDGRENLARLFILPLKPLGQGCFRFSAISVVAHEIADALSIYRWHASFLDFLNLSVAALEAEAARLCSSATDLPSRLPPAQEDLYPPISGSKAHQRWFWAISRILRHVRRPSPPSFPNPLRRALSLRQAERMPERYPALLNYAKTPPLNTYSAMANLPPSATARLRSLCRSAGVSIGAGSFAMVGLVMMILHERKVERQAQQKSRSQPDPPPPTFPFTASFPLNPRPFLTTPTTGSESSLILSFSDGLTLPFLPSSCSSSSSSSPLPLAGRFKLLARQAHRQLRVYQKRRRSGSTVQELAGKELSSRSAAQMLPQLYLYTIEREEGNLRAAGTGKGRDWDIQGAFPAGAGGSAGVKTGNGPGERVGLGATCCVSSIGDRSGLIPALSSPLSPLHLDNDKTARNPSPDHGHSHGEAPPQPQKETIQEATFAFTDLRCTVRARAAEFLVGCTGDSAGGGMSFHVSFDGCAIDPRRVEGEWVGLMEGLFEEGTEGEGYGDGKTGVEGKL